MFSNIALYVGFTRNRRNLFYLTLGSCHFVLGSYWVSKSYVCNHMNHERALQDTWRTPTIQKAVDKGYKITRFFTSMNCKTDLINTWVSSKITSTRGYK